MNTVSVVNAASDRPTWKRPTFRNAFAQATQVTTYTGSGPAGMGSKIAARHRHRVVGGASVFALMLAVGMSSSGVAAASRPTTTKAAKIGEGVQISRAPSREDQVGQQALALISYDWRTKLPGWRINFLPPRKGYLALTYRVERRIDVYVRADRAIEGIAHDIAHEIGHALDVTYLNDKTRGRFLELRQLPADTGWWACNSCRDLQTGAGDFAEVFALTAAPRFKFYSELAPLPSDEALAAIVAEVIPKVEPK